jgi:hypothetical protein
MTAYSVDVKDRKAFVRSPYGGLAIDSTADTALAAITTSSTVQDVLEILDACVARALVTTVNTTGKATSVQSDTSPTDIALSASALAASAAGDVTPVVIGTLAGISPIVTSYTYTLVAGTGDTDNADYDISGDSLRYIGTGESAGTNAIRVRATNTSGQYVEKAITITVS